MQKDHPTHPDGRGSNIAGSFEPIDLEPLKIHQFEDWEEMKVSTLLHKITPCNARTWKYILDPCSGLYFQVCYDAESLSKEIMSDIYRGMKYLRGNEV